MKLSGYNSGWREHFREKSPARGGGFSSLDPELIEAAGSG
jgi:hypothetical protein